MKGHLISQPVPKAVLKSHWLVQQQQRPNLGVGQLKLHECTEEIKEEVEITTLIFNKIDLRIDGIPENDILTDEKQMKSMSAAVEKLQDTVSNFIENYIYTQEDAAQIKKIRETSSGRNCDKPPEPSNAEIA